MFKPPSPKSSSPATTAPAPGGSNATLAPRGAPRYLGGAGASSASRTSKPKLGGRNDVSEHSAEAQADQTMQALGGGSTYAGTFAPPPPNTPPSSNRDVFGNARSHALDQGTRARFEGAMGRDLSGVRVRQGPEVDRKAEMMSARAFTLGSDIGLSNRAPQGPGHAADRLMAHELAHAVDGDAEYVRRDPLIDSVPPQVDPNSISASASFDIPGGIELYSSTSADLQTSNSTTVSLSLNRTGLSVEFSPALELDLAWYIEALLAYDMTWSGARYDFSSASTSVTLNTSGSLTEGAVTGEVYSAVSQMITSTVAGTRAATAGYDPLTDPDPQATMAQIQRNFMALPSSGGGLSPAQITNVRVGGSFTTSQEISQIEDGTGIYIASGTSVTANARLHGNARQIGAASTPQISSLSLSTSGVILRSDGEDVARLSGLTISPGGIVSIGHYTPLGVAERGEAGESTGRFLGLLLLLGGAAPSDRIFLENANPNLEPTMVRGYTRRTINRQLTAAVQQMINENATAVPGVDLREIFGMGAAGQ